MTLTASDDHAYVGDWAYLTEFTGDSSIETPDIDLSTHALTSFQNRRLSQFWIHIRTRCIGTHRSNQWPFGLV